MGAVGAALAGLILASPAGPLDRASLSLRAQAARSLPSPRAVVLPSGLAAVDVAVSDARIQLDGLLTEVVAVGKTTIVARLRLQRTASEVHRRLEAAGRDAGDTQIDPVAPAPVSDEAPADKASTEAESTSVVSPGAGRDGPTARAYERLGDAVREFEARVGGAHAAVDGIGDRIRPIRVEVERQSRLLRQSLAQLRAQRFRDGSDDSTTRVIQVGTALLSDVGIVRRQVRSLELHLAALREELGQQERGGDAKLIRRLSKEAGALGFVHAGGPGAFQLCPVDPPRSYADDFGAPRWAGGFHTHQGNDIFAPMGTPIRAVFDGRAEATGNTLGGLAVTLYGAEGFVYNAHLSEYGALGEVTAGTVIGYVGNTGDAIGTSPHNHFEWHPEGGPAVNPFVELNKVC